MTGEKGRLSRQREHFGAHGLNLPVVRIAHRPAQRTRKERVARKTHRGRIVPNAPGRVPGQTHSIHAEFTNPRLPSFIHMLCHPLAARPHQPKIALATAHTRPRCIGNRFERADVVPVSVREQDMRHLHIGACNGVQNHPRLPAGIDDSSFARRPAFEQIAIDRHSRVENQPLDPPIPIFKRLIAPLWHPPARHARQFFAIEMKRVCEPANDAVIGR